MLFRGESNDDHHAIASRAAAKVEDRSSRVGYDTDDRSMEHYESLFMIRLHAVSSISTVTDLRSQRYLSRHTRRRHVHSIVDDRFQWKVDMTHNYEIVRTYRKFWRVASAHDLGVLDFRRDKGIHSRSRPLTFRDALVSCLSSSVGGDALKRSCEPHRNLPTPMFCVLSARISSAAFLTMKKNELTNQMTG